MPDRQTDIDGAANLNQSGLALKMADSIAAQSPILSAILSPANREKGGLHRKPDGESSPGP